MLDFLLWAFVGWIVYRMIISYLELKELEKTAEEAVELIEEHARIKIIVFERVTHNDEEVILCFDNENNFVAQGPTKEEVVEAAKKRFPSKSIATYKNEELQWITTKTVNKNATVDKKSP